MNNYFLLSASLSLPIIIAIALGGILILAIGSFVVCKVVKNKRGVSSVTEDVEVKTGDDFAVSQDENVEVEQSIDNSSIDLNKDEPFEEKTLTESNEEVGEFSEEVEEDRAGDSEDEEERIVYPVEEENEEEVPVLDDDVAEDEEELQKIIHPDEVLSEDVEEVSEEVEEIVEENRVEELIEEPIIAEESIEEPIIALENVESTTLENDSCSYNEETTADEGEGQVGDSAYDDVIAKSVELGASLVEDEENNGTGKIIFGGKEIRVRYLRSFTAKLCQSNDLVKERYSLLKNELLSYRKAKARTSWHCETFRLGRPAFAKLSIRGKTLTLYLALSPEDFANTKYHFKDVSGVKKYSAVPMCLKIKSNRGVRWAKELISKLADEKGFKRLDLDEVDYYPEYRSTKELVLDKLIKLTGVDAQKEYLKIQNGVQDVEETTCENAFESEIAVTENQEILQIDNVCIDLPSNHKNHSPYAVILEVELSSENPVDETATLVEEVLEPVKDDEIVSGEENLIERDFEIQETVSVYGADKAMSNEEAESLIETIDVLAKKEVVGKAKAIINVDVLSKNFNSGDIVTLSVLKDKKLLQKNVGYFKVLGRGVINKALIVEANEFSINAAKMILLTGGRAIIVS